MNTTKPRRRTKADKAEEAHKAKLYAAMVAAVREWVRWTHPRANFIDVSSADINNGCANVIASFMSARMVKGEYVRGEPKAGGKDGAK